MDSTSKPTATSSLSLKRKGAPVSAREHSPKRGKVPVGVKKKPTVYGGSLEGISQPQQPQPEHLADGQEMLGSSSISTANMLDPQIAREFELMGNPNTLIRIPDYHQLLMPLKGIQPTVKFHIHTDPDSPRPGLEISSMPKTVACVQMAYIYCRAYPNPNPKIPLLDVMRVSEDQLKSTLKSLDHSHFLLIGVFPDTIRLEFYDLDKGSDGTGITLHQLHDVTDQDDYDMVPMTFSYVMPIDAKQFQ